jgi:thioredoxin-related protein
MATKVSFLSLLMIFMSIYHTQGQSNIHFADYQTDTLLQAYKYLHKPIFLYVTLKGCMPCKALEYQTFSDTTFANWIQRYTIPVRLNVTDKFGKDEYEKRKKSAQNLKISAFPTIIILNSEGKELERILGISTPAFIKSIISKIL